MPEKRKLYEAETVLCQCIEQARKRAGLTRMQLGKAINEKEQQIAKYESGGFVPLPKIEDIAKALGQPVQKKIIRRISFLRKLEIERNEEQPELIELYREAFSEE